ncbi:MAG: hypothetical protein HGB12_12575 [Bacteroidetes bacterium]|nr:hypothetical protein [Bacteroidota bacterium]
MKKQILFITVLLITGMMAFAQSVGINNDNSAPNSSAMLDVKSTNQGFLTPRLTEAQRTTDIASPATGLLVYQTDGTAGFYYYNGSSWTMLATAGANEPEYAYIYNTDPQVVAIEADVVFSSNGVVSSGIFHVPGTGAIVLAYAGDYEIRFNVTGVEPNQFGLFQNGAPIDGAIYGSGAGTQQNSGMVIITAAAGDVITLINHSSAMAATLQTLAGGTQINANASILIKKLN